MSVALPTERLEPGVQGFSIGVSGFGLGRWVSESPLWGELIGFCSEHAECGPPSLAPQCSSTFDPHCPMHQGPKAQSPQAKGEPAVCSIPYRIRFPLQFMSVAFEELLLHSEIIALLQRNRSLRLTDCLNCLSMNEFGAL